MCLLGGGRGTLLCLSGRGCLHPGGGFSHMAPGGGAIGRGGSPKPAGGSHPAAHLSMANRFLDMLFFPFGHFRLKFQEVIQAQRGK